MDFRQLRYFMCVAQQRSFSRAALTLHVAQSALSRQVVKLEDELGVPLLIRGKRGLQLTEAGAMLLDRAESLGEQLRKTKEDVAGYAKKPHGYLRIGVVQGAGEVILPRVLARYRALYPDVAIHLRSGISGFVHNWLNEDRIDVAVVHSPSPASSFRIEELAHGDMVLVMPPADAAGKLAVPSKRGYKIEDLAKIPLILPSRIHAQRLLIEHATAAYGFSPKVVLEVDSIPMIKALVRHGVGCTVIGFSGLSDEVATGKLRVAPLGSPGIRWNMSLVTRNDRQVTVALRVLIPILKEEIRKLVTSGTWPRSMVNLGTASEVLENGSDTG